MLPQKETGKSRGDERITLKKKKYWEEKKTFSVVYDLRSQ